MRKYGENPALLLYGYKALSPASKEREFHLLLGLLQEATLGL